MSEERGDRQAAGLPLVSVGIPVYNGARYLADALESVLAQDYANLEAVVCDNASDDGTAAIIARFCEQDSRVRCIRNPQNIGLLPNFRKVRDEARGKYFCWLSHDDLLSDPSYLRTTVAYLEEHPDVVLCHTHICFLKPSGENEIVEFPELSPDREWAEVKRDLFRWPHQWLELASTGLFRREELVQIPLPEKTRTLRPHVFCWEINLLTALSSRGRLVALPEPLRTYRSSPQSTARQMGRSVSPFDLWLLDMETKVALVLRAVRAPGSIPGRVRLGVAAVGNFSRKTFRDRFDYRTAMKMAQDEVAMLLATARERALLVQSLVAEIEARRELLIERGESPEPFSAVAAEPAASPNHPAVCPSRGRIRDFFLPASPAQIRWYAEIDYRITSLRRYCDRQLQEVDRADAEAARLLTASRTISGTGPAIVFWRPASAIPGSPAPGRQFEQ